MSNKDNGNKFEIKFANMLFRYGAWVHRLMPKADGSQPADIIAVKSGRSYLIDCKDCELDRFYFTRIEENQHHAMTMWMKCGNTIPWFALQLSTGDVYMISYMQLKMLKNMAEKQFVSISDIKFYGVNFECWCEIYL